MQCLQSSHLCILISLQERKSIWHDIYVFCFFLVPFFSVNLPHTTNFIASPKLVLNFPSGQIYSKHSSSFHVQKIAFKLYRFISPFNILMTYYHVHYCYFVQKIVLCIHLTNVNIKYPWNIYYKPVNVLVYVVTTGIFIFPDLIQFSFFSPLYLAIFVFNVSEWICMSSVRAF